MFKHSEECINTFANHEARVVAWINTYPNYCKHCGGWGGTHYSYDPSASGVSLSSGSMTYFDTCPHCYEVGICPRCGLIVKDFDIDLEIGVCPHCGWDENTPDGIEPTPECFCWENQEEE
jgi:hypothetical protein